MSHVCASARASARALGRTWRKPRLHGTPTQVRQRKPRSGWPWIWPEGPEGPASRILGQNLDFHETPPPAPSQNCGFRMSTTGLQFRTGYFSYRPAKCGSLPGSPVITPPRCIVTTTQQPNGSKRASVQMAASVLMLHIICCARRKRNRRRASAVYAPPAVHLI